MKIIICDDEGNIRDKEYEQDPWSGLSYMLYHDEADNPDCPIAHERGSSLGRWMYDTREEAIESWNKRV